MLHLVIAERFTSEGKKNLTQVWEWQKRLDEWLISHGAKFESVKHFLTLIGEPIYETWLEYANYAALDEDTEKAKEFTSDPEWQKLVAQMDIFFERVSSRSVEETLRCFGRLPVTAGYMASSSAMPKLPSATSYTRKTLSAMRVPIW